MLILDKVVRTDESSLLSTHEEVDSRIFFHVSSLGNQGNVVIKTADTDCHSIGLGYREKLDLSLEKWLEVGVQSKNNLHFISLDSIYSNLGKISAKLFPLSRV